MNGCPPEFALERYHLGEIKGTPSEVWVSHIEACPKCQAALEELKRADAGFAPLVPKHAPKPPRSIAPIAAVVLALAASILFLVVKPPEPDVTMKGSGVLGVKLIRGDQASDWNRETLHPGDALQLTWTAPQAGYLVVYGVERGKAAAALQPYGPIDASKDRLLGGRIEIDETLDDAQICALYDGQPFMADATSCFVNDAYVAANFRLKVEQKP